MNARLLTLADSKIGRKRKLVWAAFCCPPFLSPRALMRRMKWHIEVLEVSPPDDQQQELEKLQLHED